MNFCKYTMTLILISLNAKPVCNASIDGKEDVEGENENEPSLNQPEDVNLDGSVIEAIERSALQALAQKLPQFFPTTSHGTDENVLDNTDESSSSTFSSLVDRRVQRAIDESVAFHLDQMLATITLEKRTDKYSEKHSYATVTKSGRKVPELDDSFPTITSSTALPARQTKPPLVSEESEGSARSMSYAASLMKGKSTVQHNQPPASSSSQSVMRDSSKPDRIDESNDRSLLITPVILGENVQAELKKAGINLNEFCVMRAKSYPSGALRCTCYNEGYKRKLEHAVRGLPSVSVKGKQMVYTNVVRLQGVPNDVKEDEISECVQVQFSMSPEDISFIPYQDRRSDRVKAVSIFVDDALLRVMKEHSQLRIRDQVYNIDTRKQATRCSNCKLLGHGVSRCGYPSRSMESVSKSTKCIDCSFYNEQMIQLFGKASRSRIRDVNHPTDDDKCPSKLHFMRPKRYVKGSEESSQRKS